MSENAPTSLLMQYCTCEACLHDSRDLCELIANRAEHLQVVSTLLTYDPADMIFVGYDISQQDACISIHANILCYWSPTIRNAVYQSPEPVSFFWIDFSETRGRSMSVWKHIVQWCYTGRLLDEVTLSDATIGSGDDIESLWSAAASLEMYELCNYCLRLIIIKYTWGIGAVADPGARFLPRDCPYDAYGAYFVFKSRRRGAKFQRLVRFFQDLLMARGPTHPAARALANDHATWTWATYANRDEEFGAWITDLGGVDHDYRNGILPTHFNQWHKYQFQILPRVPSNAQQWAVAHSERVAQGAAMVSLQGEWRRLGEGLFASDEWLFRVVENDRNED
ncbi:hypothetical protein F5Y04DRAFT_291471 [Hypomontagnella monticulosa]|nr:hypothetical protein F5Y04DRAFT_291471 [Hypomontagnella monticulosa]